MVERALIVAFLRRLAEGDAYYRAILTSTADRIEQGEHHAA